MGLPWARQTKCLAVGPLVSSPPSAFAGPGHSSPRTWAPGGEKRLPEPWVPRRPALGRAGPPPLTPAASPRVGSTEAVTTAQLLRQRSRQIVSDAQQGKTPVATRAKAQKKQLGINPLHSRIALYFRTLRDQTAFQAFIIGVIFLAGVLVGINTYDVRNEEVTFAIRYVPALGASARWPRRDLGTPRNGQPPRRGRRGHLYRRGLRQAPGGGQGALALLPGPVSARPQPRRGHQEGHSGRHALTALPAGGTCSISAS